MKNKNFAYNGEYFIYYLSVGQSWWIFASNRSSKNENVPIKEPFKRTQNWIKHDQSLRVNDMLSRDQIKFMVFFTSTSITWTRYQNVSVKSRWNSLGKKHYFLSIIWETSKYGDIPYLKLGNTLLGPSLVVSMLVFYTDDPSLNPAVKLLEKNENWVKSYDSCQSC